ncbi:hypothetical protein [Oscillibacter sp.]|uniref:hypothetical protein n=1 Tax=Oscillibacter sp. TaxID=1945593 RepID=UPI00289EF1E7|nr:hypothetical protein [Oscillibacter sp.]
MKESQTNITYRRLELKLSKIAAKIAGATYLPRQAKELAVNSEHLLIDAQTEIDDLYSSLEDCGPMSESWPDA